MFVEAFFKHGDSWLVYEKDRRFDIVIITYTQPLATQSICSLFQIADGTCAQSDLDCSYTKYDKAAKKYANLFSQVHLSWLTGGSHVPSTDLR